MTTGRSHHLQHLRRRRNHLDARIREVGNLRNVDYDKAERSALNWAIEFIEAHTGCATTKGDTSGRNVHASAQG